MKIDLIWAFDCIDWEFLTMILYKIGFKHRHIRWIMACNKYASMEVFINGDLTNFFKINIGLRQDCALSPLLFILVMDTLSKRINSMKEVGDIKGCGISKNSRLSQLMFLDNIMCPREEKISEWEALHKIYLKLSNASRLNFNKNKTKLIFDGGSLMEVIVIASMFEIKTSPLSNGFK